VSEVLDLARIEAGRLDMSLEPVELAPLLAEALARVESTATERSVIVDSVVAGAACGWVTADRQRLLQVLFNLLSNAVQYNRPGGWVKVSCGTSGGRIRIEVAKTGTDIGPDVMPCLLQPFERLDGTPSGIEGTGLGLALSQRLAEAMGGTMGAESDVGQGSRFWVELLAAETPSVGRPVHALPGIGDDDTGRLTVLYIEDNLSNIRLVERILLDRPDVRLITAMRGRLGLDLARQQSPDLVLLDLHLPDLPGDDVLDRLQADAALADIPVVVLSADASPHRVDRLLQGGAHDYLTKPIDIHRFLAVIDQLAASREAPRAAQRPPGASPS
jgi:CheY-like chemotaxis protein/anti-sigma regulatory factor (Ser/Thr protein kinase)